MLGRCAVARFGVDAVFFRAAELVVGGEGGWRRSRVVLQADAHQERTLDPSGEVLWIDITEGPTCQFPRVLGISAQPVPDDHPRPGCHLERFHGVGDEGDIRRTQRDALVERCGGE